MYKQMEVPTSALIDTLNVQEREGWHLVSSQGYPSHQFTTVLLHKDGLTPPSSFTVGSDPRDTEDEIKPNRECDYPGCTEKAKEEISIGPIKVTVCNPHHRRLSGMAASVERIFKQP